MRIAVAIGCVVVSSASLSAGELSGKIVIELFPSAMPGAAFEVRGLPAGVLADLSKLAADDPRWKRIFRVYVQAEAVSPASQPPPMLGTWRLTAGSLRFQPRFPLERGLTYRAVFEWRSPQRATAAGLRAERTLILASLAPGPPTRLVAIYPSGDELPENLLRFYLQFSAPMSQGHSYAYMSLRDVSGASVGVPFLELAQELWSTDGKRLTLLLDPGRVKQGLKPREESGAVLQPGHNYALAVDAKWPDAEGRSLKEAALKKFRVGPPETSQSAPATWKIEAPRAGSRDPLMVRFPMPLDHAMLDRVLHVLFFKRRADSEGTEVSGSVQILDGERRWTFEPREPWGAGRYALAFSTDLEDRAGNSVARPFEVDLNRTQPPPVAAVMHISFTIP